MDRRILLFIVASVPFTVLGELFSNEIIKEVFDGLGFLLSFSILISASNKFEKPLNLQLTKEKRLILFFLVVCIWSRGLVDYWPYTLVMGIITFVASIAAFIFLYPWQKENSQSSESTTATPTPTQN